MKDISTTIMTGRLTKDPEIKKTQNGTSVMQFSLAVNDTPTKDGQQLTDFIQCVAWRTTADYIAAYCHKGDALAVEGRLKTRHYTHPTTNQEVYITEVRVSSVVKMNWQKKTDQASTQQQKQQPVTQDLNEYGFDTGASLDISSDDLPF